MAHVIVSKFGDHLPLYRLEHIFARQGVPLRRSTLCNWLAQAAEVLTPLCHLMAREVLRSLVVQSDGGRAPGGSDRGHRPVEKSQRFVEIGPAVITFVPLDQDHREVAGI